jgi:hypothetical protein
MKTLPFIIMLALTTLLTVTARGEDSEGDQSSGFVLLPGRILFSPLVANAQEPRTGLRKEIGSSRLKLNIGTTMDILQYTPSGESVLRLGIEFFTYALSTSNQGLRLQIAAVDGFFGGHVTWSPHGDVPGMRLRLRLLHVSAHLIDGSYDTNTGQWRNNRLPIPYTRDFGELVAAYSDQQGSIHFRVYSGFSYATLVRPSNLKRLNLIAGGEVRSTGFPGSLLGTQTAVYLAYHFLLSGAPAYAGGNAVEAGVKIGEWTGSGVKLYLSYDHGPEVFSQFYDMRRTAWGLGLAFDFW